MSDKFFFRVRGEVKGPFSREQIISLIRKKRLGRHHELSADCVNWRRAGDVEGLFDSIMPEERVSQNEPEAEVRPGTGEPPAGVVKQAGMSPVEFQSALDDWFYAKGLNTHGPVSSKDLRAMLATGRLLGSDRVWNDSLSDWVPASDLPQFMGSIPDAGNLEIRRSQARNEEVTSTGFFNIFLGLSSDTATPGASSQKFPNLCRYLAIAESVFRILFVLQVLVATGWYAFLMIRFIQAGIGAAEIVLCFVSIAALMLAIAVLWFLFLASMAMLELLKVVIRIEHNTSSGSM